MSCPYRTHLQFVGWLVTYKGWKRADALKLKLHTMRKMYYEGTPNLKKNLPVLYKNEAMDFDEACRWYQEQEYKERHVK